MVFAGAGLKGAGVYGAGPGCAFERVLAGVPAGLGPHVEAGVGVDTAWPGLHVEASVEAGLHVAGGVGIGVEAGLG